MKSSDCSSNVIIISNNNNNILSSDLRFIKLQKSVAQRSKRISKKRQ